ncbi:unnamed protein product [Arctogadus glacialis]
MQNSTPKSPTSPPPPPSHNPHPEPPLSPLPSVSPAEARDADSYLGTIRRARLCFSRRTARSGGSSEAAVKSTARGPSCGFFSFRAAYRSLLSSSATRETLERISDASGDVGIDPQRRMSTLQVGVTPPAGFDPLPRGHGCDPSRGGIRPAGDGSPRHPSGWSRKPTLPHCGIRPLPWAGFDPHQDGEFG